MVPAYFTLKVVCDIADAYPCGGCFYCIFLFRIDQKSQSSICIFVIHTSKEKQLVQIPCTLEISYTLGCM